MPVNIFISSVTKPLFTDLSVDSTLGKDNDMVTKLDSILRLIYVFIIPISMFIISLKEPLISFIFERGMFTSDAVIKTANCLALYSIAIFAISANNVISLIFYASNNVRFPLQQNIFLIITSTILNLVLSRKIGVMGMALGTSIAQILTLCISYFNLKSYYKVSLFKEHLRVLLKLTVLCCSVGLILRTFLLFINNYVYNSFFTLLIAGFTGILLLIIFGRKVIMEEIGNAKTKTLKFN
jgi:putative peptidoglycan lipid II flippase